LRWELLQKRPYQQHNLSVPSAPLAISNGGGGAAPRYRLSVGNRLGLGADTPMMMRQFD